MSTLELKQNREQRGVERRRTAHDSATRLTGQVVEIPAQEFGVDIPQLLYRGKVVGKDPHRKGAVVVRFEEDGSKYWLPAADVQRWIDEMQAAGRTPADTTIGVGADEFAASVLTELLTEKRRSSSCQTASCSDGAASSVGYGAAAVPEWPTQSCGQGPRRSPTAWAEKLTDARPVEQGQCWDDGQEVRVEDSATDRIAPFKWGATRSRQCGRSCKEPQELQHSLVDGGVASTCDLPAASTHSRKQQQRWHQEHLDVQLSGHSEGVCWPPADQPQSSVTSQLK